jgi:transcriptional regulator with XRE-family HTH domain
MDQDIERALVLSIGRRVARRRAALKLALDEVGARTGVSRAMISRIERGEVHASAVVLDKLCAGLGMTLSTLFARSTPSQLSSRADQSVWKDPASGYTRREVAPSGTGSPVRIVDVDFPAGATISLEKSRHRLIDQHVWILAGQIEITLSERVYSLATGDCLHMRPDEGITFRNVTGKPARYAVILISKSIA